MIYLTYKSSPRWLNGKVWALGPEVPGSRPNSTEDPPCMGPAACEFIRSVQTSSDWCDTKIPTLALPTQEECKAARGPAGREPSHQHVEDGIYWVQ
ncbi:hypothetical protein AVEN_47425-1 [Araneus ventricosus]|uniref:Uncharacterized protein n=1 Tax=Araneus ventricosus TaxID=182803 RepID=A0A4Y2KPL3_ARAVE|nr:hypothetical protein AVEN_47425-1 [Araneus ventricosus]